MFEEFIVQFFHGYAYQPGMVYLAVVLFMLASAFGLPLPEELTLVTAGFLAYIGLNPLLYPPPEVGASVVNVHLLALVAFCAVFGSDFVVYSIGRVYGVRILDSKFMARFLNTERRVKIEALTAKYGLWAVALFRFMPGVRFPGHVACGAVGIKAHKFMLVDGLAAALSVPTQIYLVGFYGKEILGVLQEVKIVLAVALGIFLLVFFIKKFHQGRVLKRAALQKAAAEHNNSVAG